MANHLRKCYALIRQKQEASINTKALESPQQAFGEYVSLMYKHLQENKFKWKERDIW